MAMIQRIVRGWFCRGMLCGLMWLTAAAPCSGADVSGRLDNRRPSQRRPDLPEYLPGTPADDFVLPPAPAAPAPVPGAVMFELKGVVFEGNSVVTDAALHAVTAPFVGQPVGVSEIEEMRYRLTRLYVDRGYINSGAVILPGQRLDEGIVTFTLEEGRLDRINVTGNGRLQAQYIQKRLWPDPAQPFNTTELQTRFRLLLQDPLIARMDGRIRPGESPGSAILDLSVVRSRPVSMGLTVDNHHTPSTGEAHALLSGSLHNLTGWGDIWDASVGISEGADDAAIGISIPLNTRDTRLSLRYNRDNNDIIEAPLDAIDVESESQDVELALTHPIFRNLQRRFDVGLSLCVLESDTFLLGRPFSFSPGVVEGESQVGAIRLVQSFVDRSRGHALALRSTLSLGVDLFGPTVNSGGLPDSRYASWLGQVQFARRIGEKFGQIILRGDVQIAEDRLLPLEQFAVGGAHSVRGYRENTRVRDNGYAISLEWRYPLLTRQIRGGVTEVLQMAPFMDYGSARNKGEHPSDNTLHAIGVGMIFTPRPGLSASVYWAHDIHEIATESDYSLQDDGLHLQFRFTLP